MPAASLFTRARRSSLLADVRTGGTDARMRVRAAALKWSGELDAVTEVGGCPCLASAEGRAVLRDLGLSTVDPETPEQWTRHAREEDKDLFPKLRTIAELWLDSAEAKQLVADVDTLEREHEVFVYPQTALGEMPDEGVMKRHGDLEMLLLKKYGNRLRKLVGVPIKKDGDAAERMAFFARTGASGGDSAGGLYIAAGTTDLTPSDLALYKGEKFADPWWSCIDKKEGPNESTNSLAYLLATPKNGRDRVAAMRARLASLGKMDKGRVLKETNKASVDTFINIATDIEKSFRTTAGQEELATRLGVSVATLASKAIGVRSVLGVKIDAAALEPIFKQLFGLIGPQIIDGIQRGIASLAGAAAAAQGFGAAMKAVPFIGQTVGLIFEAGIADDNARKQRAIDQCSGANQQIVDAMKAISIRRYPFSWHFEPFGETQCDNADTAWDNSGHAENLAARLREWYDEFEAMPIPVRSPAIEWWNTATTYMNDPRVVEVFTKFGRDYWGGRLASDEQVMLVATPIAVANGFDVDQFAAALWDRSGGWSTTAAVFPDSPNLLHKNALRSDETVYCDPTVRNALFLQYALLAKTALELAEEWRKTPAYGRLLSSLSSSTKTSLPPSLPKITGDTPDSVGSATAGQAASVASGIAVAGGGVTLGLLGLVPVWGAAVAAAAGLWLIVSGASPTAEAKQATTANPGGMAKYKGIALTKPAALPGNMGTPSSTDLALA